MQERRSERLPSFARWTEKAPIIGGPMTDILTSLRDATEGSRELDARLYYKRQRDKDAILLNGRTWRQCMEFSEVNGDWSGLARAMDAPHYTTSIDAALTLGDRHWREAIEAAMMNLVRRFPRYDQPLTKEMFILALCEVGMAKEDDGGSTRVEVAEAVGFDDPYDHGQCNRADDPA